MTNTSSLETKAAGLAARVDRLIERLSAAGLITPGERRWLDGETLELPPRLRAGTGSRRRCE